MTAPATSPERSGLTILWDIIVAPTSAFEALRERTHWGWAYLVVCVLGVGGALLQIPAGVHLVAVTFANNSIHDPALASKSPEELATFLAQAQSVQRIAWIFFPVIAIGAIAITAGIFAIGNALAKGDSSFGRLFGFAANLAVINFGIAYLLIGILAALKGPSAFATERDILTLLPSLAWAAPGASPKLVALLATFNPFQIWSLVITAAGLGSIAKLARGPAYAIAVIVTFGTVLVSVPFAK